MRHYHLIGIAGTAMGSLAGLLRARGHAVTGSDEGVYPPMSDVLDQLGIAYAQRFDPANLEPAPDVVIVGNAISRGNPELEAVLERRLPYTSAAAVLKEEFLHGRHVVAVAGTHGKTTTASLVAWLLECAGLHPAFLIGGVAENFGRSFRLTEAELFVVEADEYDTAYFDKGPKMWHYLPWTAVVTNVEFDHADIFRDELAYRFAFERFVNLVPRTGTLVLGWDDAGARALAPRSFAPVASFGLDGAGMPAAADAAADADDAATSVGRISHGGTAAIDEDVDDAATSAGRISHGGTADVDDPATSAGSVGDGAAAAGGPDPRDHPRWRADDVAYGRDGTAFTVVHDGRALGRVETPLSGAFNVRNALAAVAAATAAGASWEGIREGLATFRSVRRRQEVRGEVGGVTVIDDFAHHPTAVAGTIAAVRQRFDGRRVLAVFEPRSYTAQRREFQEGFRRALAGADRVILAGLFHPERYDAGTGMDPHELVAALGAGGVPAAHIPEVDRIVEAVGAEARAGDIVLVMSNGGFGGIHGKLLDALEARQVRPARPAR